MNHSTDRRRGQGRAHSNSFRQGRALLVRVASALLVALTLIGCGGKPDVVIYCSLDKNFAEPFLAEFQKESGLKVRAIYDTEAVKTVGLVTTLVEEKDNPRADIFWNNELGNTVKLQNLGLLAPYKSKNAETIPDTFKDPDGYWTGFAARARILIVNTDLVPEADTPQSMYDLLDPRWKGKCGIARPLAGTTLTHFTALQGILGDAKFDEFLAGLRENDVEVATGNAHLMRNVAAGSLHWGFTDTDDYNLALTDNKPVRAVYPDQDGIGTMVIPNSVMLIKGGPNPDNARILIDYILSPETEAKLARSRSAQIPLHPGVDKPESVKSPGDGDFKAMEVDFVKVGNSIDDSIERLSKEFLK